MAERSRLSLALAGGDIMLPETGRIAVFGPRAGADLSALPAERTRIFTRFRPDHDHFAALGHDCALAPEGRFGASIVCVPRAKDLARARVAQAAAVTDGPVIVDGAKSDGVESLLKACRARVDVAAVFSKAHGKVFSFRAGPGFADWTAAPRQIEGGFVTLPGVFSADGIDPGSRMLAAHLPATLGRTVVDLGGGWGYLGARALERAEIERLHLVEADHDALDCARRNVPDPRLRLHWENATRWHAPAPVDSVIMNPPFHSGRAPDPAMGAAFIRAAAAMLTPGGQLWMVGNRHLPYEPVLAEHFARSEEVAGDTRFKILHAARPSRLRRRDALG